MPEFVIEWLATASWLAASVVFFLENLLIFGLVILLGEWLVRRYRVHPVSEPPEPLTRTEIAIGLVNVLLNTLVTLLGWQLWQRGVIRFRNDVGVGALLDVVVLMLVMDFLMYGLHRLAHHRWLFSLTHEFHHRYERVRPLTLFALNPLENLAFGGLWLLVVCVYPASWLGMSIYLTLNVAFGAIGHLGVEPLSFAKMNRPLLRHVAGSSFHAQHHQDAAHNFGFYTLLWDRLFDTLRTDYAERYGRP